MKQEFSKSWIASKQPRKQRKYLFNAPTHLKRKMLSALLDKTLKIKYGRRNVEVRKGDEVLVMRGKFAKQKGKVGKVNLDKLKITIEGLQRNKRDGNKVDVWFSPSKVKIVAVADDAKRFKTAKKVESKETKEDKN